MKKILILIFIFLSFLAQSQTKNVLFIGNSYTFTFDIPQITANMASSVGDHLNYQTSAISGYSLLQHSTYTNTLNLIRQGGWDYVVLQEFSQNPSQPLEWVEQNVYPYAQFLDGEINNYNSRAETIFYMTWGRRDGDTERCSYMPEVCTYIGMDDLTRERYMYMAEANHGIVSPVGAVWRYIRQNYPSIELYNADGSHPSEAGSYAAACSFYTTIFRKDPTNITYNFTLSSSDAEIIRNAAKQIVYNDLLTWHIGEYDPDTQAPTIPAGLASGSIAETSFTLTWAASSDNKGVTGYEVYRNGVLITTVTAASANITGLTASTTYAMTVKAKDAANNISSASSTLNVTTNPHIPGTLNVTGVTAANKVYDGTINATLITTGATLVGVTPGDVVSLIPTGATGTFANRNAGTGKAITITGFTLGGIDAPKYTLIQPTTFADITKASLTISGVTANSREYNATTRATLNLGNTALSGVRGSDVVTLNSTGAIGTFANKNAGSGKAVSTSGFTLGGTDAGNYTLTQPSLTANITIINLTVSDVTANKVYDRSTLAILNTGNAYLVGLMPGDAVTLISTSATGTFSDRNVGTGKAVSTSGFRLGGTDSGNYTLTQPSFTADISPADLTVSGITANKVYDRTTVATLNTSGASLTGLVPGDAVTLSTTGVTGTFSNKNAGTGKAVSTSGFTIGGTDSGNYSFTQPTVLADITPYSLRVTGITAANKIYDRTTAAVLNTGSAVLLDVLTGDDASLVLTGAAGNFANKIVGTGKTVLISGLTLRGTDAGNYSVTQPTTLADITSAGLTISGLTASNRGYNGTTSATLNAGSAVLTGLFSGDIVTLVSGAATGNFANKNVGTGKPISTSGFLLAGTDAGNYTLTQPVTSANITAANLTVTGLTANNKVYDGMTTATLNTGNSTLSGIFGSDVVNLIPSGAIGTFADKNAGTGKAVYVTGLSIGGTGSGNYTLVLPVAIANITPAGLVVSGVTVNNKVYNSTTTATLNSSNASITGILGNDAVSLITAGATGNFVNKNAGTGKAVVSTGFSIGGTDARNYSLTQPSLTGNITRSGLTTAGVRAINKVYDGTTAANLNVGSAVLSGVFGTDEVYIISAGATGTFSDKNAGTAKIVSTALILGGADSDNYSLIQSMLTADISPKALIIVPNTLTKSYRTKLTFTGTEFTAEGLIQGDIVTGVILNSPGTDPSALVGTYPISAEGGENNNYSFTYGSGILSVNKAPVIVTADNKTKVYGSENPSLSVSYSGFLNNEDESVLGARPVVSTTALTTSNVGIYAITLSGGSDNNYDLILVNGSLKIEKAPLTITAENKTRSYGQINPVLTITYSGFVMGQTESVLDVRPEVETEANINSDAGNYEITLSKAADANYNIISKNGILKINKADQLINFEQIAGQLRMTLKQQLKATASSSLPVSFEISDPSIGIINGNVLTINKDGKLIVRAVQGGNNNWNPAPEVEQSIVTLPTFDNISSLFTPNSDGMNDYWYIPELEQYGKLQVTVYNRFEQAVYRSDSYKNDWDGTWNGYPLPSGSYYYIIKSSTKGFIKGVVNIVR